MIVLIVVMVVLFVGLVVVGRLAWRYRLRAEEAAAMEAAAVERTRACEAVLSRWEGESRYLAERRLPDHAEAVRLGRGDEVPGLLYPELAESVLARAHESVLEAVGEAERRAEDAARGVLLDVARTIQGQANHQQVTISEVLARHDDPGLFEDLIGIDHVNAQILLRAAAMAAVCGSWPGRQHDPTPLLDVLRGALGRVLDWRRVDIVHLQDTRAVIGRVVEPLVLTVAQLVDNATRFSSPATRVEIFVRLTHSGVAVVIDDAGVGLPPAEQARVRRRLNNPGLAIRDLGSPPRFGLAACGAYGRRYGFTVTADTPSPWGGVRAVIAIPGTLLTTPAEPSAASDKDAPPHHRIDEAAPRDEVELQTVRDGNTASGLPKRKRARPTPVSSTGPDASPVPSGEGVVPAAGERASRVFGAFQRAGREANNHDLGAGRAALNDG